MQRKLAAQFLPMKKQLSSGGGIRKAGGKMNLPVFVIIFSVIVFAVFMYNEDVKSIAEFPFSSSSSKSAAASAAGAGAGAVSHQEIQETPPNHEHPVEDTVAAGVSSSENRETGNKMLLAEGKSGEHHPEDDDDHDGGIDHSASSVSDADEEKRNDGGKEEEEVVVLGPEAHEVAMTTTTDKKDDDEDDEEEEEGAVELPPDECDLYTGEWVFDNVTRPLYKEGDCEFLTEQVTCMRNGRKDSTYQKWKWQPRDCSLPRFSPKLLAQKLRNKRLMFVGDSLNRNQWESMVCFVQSVAPSGRKSLNLTGSFKIFRLEDYNATVEFYWAPFLVDSNSDDPNMHSIQNRIIKPKSISKHAVNWKDVDYLIFNTYIWWMNTFDIKILRNGSFAQGTAEYYEVPRPEAYKRVMKTWSKWVDKNINPNRTSVFFATMSPVHIKSLDWNNPDGIKCARETTPVLNATTPPEVGTDMRLFAAAVEATKSMKRVPVEVLNITAMSEYRKDAHTSVFTIRQGKLLTPEQMADPENFADCIHWCLPGLPDTWNEFLYTRILTSGRRSTNTMMTTTTTNSSSSSAAS